MQKWVLIATALPSKESLSNYKSSPPFSGVWACEWRFLNCFTVLKPIPQAVSLIITDVVKSLYDNGNGPSLSLPGYGNWWSFS